MIDLLKNVRIVDITAIVMGPYATQMLADMGADVIKVEPLEGEIFRNTPPAKSRGMGAHSLNCNRNKRSLAVDLKTEAGRKILTDLIKGADVVIHNMRAKAAKKLGIDYASITKLNPTAIFCEAWGYGQEGPYRDEPAFDDIIQSYSGLASINANEEGVPRFFPTIICDKVTALYVTQAILGALYHRAVTGKGAHLEVPMYETNVAFFMLEHLSGETFVPPEGGLGYLRIMERKPMPTKDGYITSGVYTHAHWIKFLNAIGREDLVAHAWLKSQATIAANIDKLYALMAKEIMPARTSAEWLEILRQLDIPCAPVLGLSDLLDNPHLKAVSLFETVNHPTEGQLRTIRLPYRVEGVGSRPDTHAPRIGEHTQSLLETLGYDSQQINALFSAGVVASDSLDVG